MFKRLSVFFVISFNLSVVLLSFAFADPNEDLMAAAVSGDTAGVRLALEQGANPDFQSTPGGFTALHYAAKGGRDQIINLLLDKGASVDSDNRQFTPLIAATLSNRSDAVRKLLAHGAQSNYETADRRTPLMSAAQYGFFTIVVSLIPYSDLNQRSTLDGKTALELATESGHHAIVELLRLNGAR